MYCAKLILHTVGFVCLALMPTSTKLHRNRTRLPNPSKGTEGEFANDSATKTLLHPKQREIYRQTI